MRITRARLFAAAAVLICVGSLATSASASDATEPRTATLNGQARLAYLADPADDVRFTVDARASYRPGSPIPVTVSGTARVYHRHGDVAVWAEIAVDCLTVGGPTATVTGIVVDAAPGIRDWVDRGVRLGFSVYDSGHAPRDRAGFTGPSPVGEPLHSKCLAPAAQFGVREGGYTIGR